MQRDASPPHLTVRSGRISLKAFVQQQVTSICTPNLAIEFATMAHTSTHILSILSSSSQAWSDCTVRAKIQRWFSASIKSISTLSQVDEDILEGSSYRHPHDDYLLSHSRVSHASLRGTELLKYHSGSEAQQSLHIPTCLIASQKSRSKDILIRPPSYPDYEASKPSRVLARCSKRYSQ